MENKIVKLIVQIAGGIVAGCGTILSIISKFANWENFVSIITIISSVAGLIATFLPQIFDITKKLASAVKETIETKNFEKLKEEMNKYMVGVETTGKDGATKLDMVLASAESFAKNNNLCFDKEACINYINSIINESNKLAGAKKIAAINDKKKK